jgi:transcription elongation GreA/GreB family factor
MASKKHELLSLVIAELEKQKRELEAHAEETHRYATEAPSPMESNSDKTRFEMNSLHGNMVEVIMGYERTLKSLDGFVFPEEGSVVGFGSLVDVSNEHGATSTIFLLPAVRNVTVKYDGTTCVAISPETPLGGALIGKREGDEVLVNTRRIKILRVR